MGMFDMVHTSCPCGGTVVFQSKAGDCILKSFNAKEVPLEIARDISGDSSVCDKCNKEYMITVYNLPPPPTVQMRLVEVE